MKKTGLFIGALLVFQISFAQDQKTEEDYLETDRPSISDAPTVVPPGTFQLETGFFYQQDEEYYGKEKEFHYPETALRIGLFKRTELRLKAELKHYRFSLKNRPEPLSDLKSPTGFDNISAGFKVQLIDKKDSGTNLALQIETTIPIESKEYRSREPEPELRLAIAQALTDKLSLHMNLGTRFQDPGGDVLKHTIDPLYTFSLAYELNKKLELFTEVYGQRESQSPFEHGFDTGFGYKLTPNLEIDAYGGLGLNEEAPDFFISTGVSFRLPK